VYALKSNNSKAVNMFWGFTNMEEKTLTKKYFSSEI
jgi:hypothetical protein